jgi:hypothetical protein
MVLAADEYPWQSICRTFTDKLLFCRSLGITFEQALAAGQFFQWRKAAADALGLKGQRRKNYYIASFTAAFGEKKKEGK